MTFASRGAAVAAASVLTALLLTVLSLSVTGGGHAQEQYPSRTVTLVAPITAGTAIDILARLYADQLSKRLGQQVVVANRAGAGGMIGAQAVATAAADGYTLIFVNSGHAILGGINKNLTFDPVADFAGVALVGEAPGVVVVAPSLGVNSLKEFVALAKAKPGTINYGSAGIGTSTHLAGAYFAMKTGTDLVHVPYTVSATIIADLLGGRIQASFVPMAFVLPLLQDGRLKALAVAAREPITSPLQIPTALSQGVDYEYATWYGMLAPAKTPKPILATLAKAMSEASGDADLRSKMQVQGIIPALKPLEQFDTHIRNDMTRLAPLLKEIAANK